jgi:V/A-type H+/Na+-transporting ATPase subunit I
MIEKMLKTTIICRIEDRDSTLDSLRSLGMLHVEQVKRPDSPTQTVISYEIDNANHIVGTLSSEYNPIDKTTYNHLSGEELTKEAIRLFENNVELKKDLEICHRNKDKLLPWGSFSFSKIDSLKEKGLFVYLCESNHKEELKNYQDKSSIEIVNTNKNKIYFALISTEELKKNQLPLAPLPLEKISLAQIEENICNLNKKIEDINTALSVIVSDISKIKEHVNLLKEELEFITNKNGMGNDYVLCYIKGFIPVTQHKILALAAKKQGWAIMSTEPSSNDNPPTLLHVPKIFKIADPIFEFIGISPGYQEWDVSICFLFFFTIFFGMIVGDAGYGAIFFIIAIISKIVFRKNLKLKLPINLFLVLSIATIIWGSLTCSFFALPQEVFPRQLQGLKSLTDPTIKDKNIQYICFLIAAIHLSFARIWKSILICNSFRALGQLGWAMVIWGNFFTAIKLIVFNQDPFPTFAFYLYVIGIVLILVFYVQWTDIGSIFNLPFGFIGSFVDVLSYIRLFAVGLATYYIANSFNNMGNMLLQISPWLIVGTIIVLLFGHILNILLALMGVLVHGIRLNTLEFSNQMELQWLGHVYTPFKKQTKMIEEKEEEKERI